MSALPTELKALTKRAAGAPLQPLHQRVFERGEELSTPPSGGASAIGLVASMTTLPARFVASAAQHSPAARP